VTKPGKAPQPKKVTTTASAKRAVSKTGQPTAKQVHSAETWEKKSSGSWTAGQSTGLNPGDPKAVSRLRHSGKYKARKKHVIRPRIVKQHKPDTGAK
jgi:hypothetical protein